MGDRLFGWASDHLPSTHAHGPRLSADERLDIQQALVRYVYALDHADLIAMRDVLSEGASWRIASSAGDAVAVEGREAILEAVDQATSALTAQRRHHLTTVHVSEQENGEASAHSYFLLTESTGEASTLLVTGFYEVTLTRTPHGWRIGRIVVGLDNPAPDA